jgi:ABC-type Na+ efflux pump permease subunit
MKSIFFKAVDKAAKEASLWAYAAWTLPFVAIAVLVFEYLIGWDTAMARTLTTIAIVFFSISVFWWWWALHKITVILGSLKETDARFEDIKEELRQTRKTLRGDDVDLR